MNGIIVNSNDYSNRLNLNWRLQLRMLTTNIHVVCKKV